MAIRLILVGAGLTAFALFYAGFTGWGSPDPSRQLEARILVGAAVAICLVLSLVRRERRARREWDSEWDRAQWDVTRWDRLGQLEDEHPDDTTTRPVDPTQVHE